MPRKKKSQKGASEPTAIVHTRALLIKQSDELAKLIEEETLNLEQAKINLMEAQNAHSAVQVALTTLYRKGTSDALVDGAPPSPPDVKYVSEEKAQLHNCICSLMKQGGKWRPAALRIKAMKVLGVDCVDYDNVQQVLAHLVRLKKVIRPERGYYMWLNISKQEKQESKLKRGKKKRKRRHSAEFVGLVKGAVANRLQTGGKYTAAKLLDILSAHPSYMGVDYALVWYCLDRLVTEKKVTKVSKGTYQWKGALRKKRAKVAGKKSTKKSSKKAGRGGGKPPAAWMEPANKELASYEMLSLAQLKDCLKKYGHNPSDNAISKYLRRQLKKGKLKQVGWGYYATVD